MKNFKCQNANCGVSFKAEKLGPCPVCGCEITKPDKNNLVLKIFVFLIILSSVIFAIAFNDLLMPSGKELPTGIYRVDSTETSGRAPKVDTLATCYSDVRITKPLINKEKKKVTVIFASNSDSCEFLYTLNKYKTQKSKTFTINSDFEKTKNFIISVFSLSDSLLVSKTFSNPYFVKQDDIKTLEKHIKDFKEIFNDYLKDLKENQESDLGFELNSIFVEKLGLDADKFKLNVKYKKSKSSVKKSLNGILNDLENDAFSDIYYSVKIDFNKQTVAGKSSIKKIDINLLEI